MECANSEKIAREERHERNLALSTDGGGDELGAASGAWSCIGLDERRTSLLYWTVHPEERYITVFSFLHTQMHLQTFFVDELSIPGPR